MPGQNSPAGIDSQQVLPACPAQTARLAQRRRRPFRRIERSRVGPGDLPLGVQTLVRDAQVLEHAAVDDRLVDDAPNILGPNPAIPDLLWIDNDRGSVFALVQAAGPIRPDRSGELMAFQFRGEEIAQRFAGIRIAAAAAVPRLARVAANKDVAGKAGHRNGNSG
jgi:hypothetical protein